MSTQVLKYSSTKPKLSYICKDLDGTQVACTLHKHRSMQPEPNSLNIRVPTLKLIYNYLDAIFVPLVLGTCQGMSTKAGDRKMYENLHKLA